MKEEEGKKENRNTARKERVEEEEIDRQNERETTLNNGMCSPRSGNQPRLKKK